MYKRERSCILRFSINTASTPESDDVRASHRNVTDKEMTQTRTSETFLNPFTEKYFFLYIRMIITVNLEVCLRFYFTLLQPIFILIYRFIVGLHTICGDVYYYTIIILNENQIISVNYFMKLDINYIFTMPLVN